MLTPADRLAIWNLLMLGIFRTAGIIEGKVSRVKVLQPMMSGFCRTARYKGILITFLVSFIFVPYCALWF
jgi:hypothetical protein